MRKRGRGFLLMLMLVLLCSVTPTYARDLDTVNQRGTTRSSGSTSATYSEHNEGVTDYLKGYTPITEENMQKAQHYASPLTNLMGYVTGLIVVLVFGGVFVVTALDLCYIGIPFTRKYLNPSQQSGGGGMGMGQPSGGSSSGTRWVSDEAVACVAQASGGSGGMQGGMGSMGMMGGGGGQQQSTKSTIMTYLKKRTFFIILFVVATLLLTSSIFLDCGINLAQLSFKIMDKVNEFIVSVEF